jgi:hypothetical protein
MITNISDKPAASILKGDGTPKKLATATDFKQAIGFQIGRRTMRKLKLHKLHTSY